MKSLAISDMNGCERFVTLETRYSLASRTIENELVPACLDQGVAILAWSPLHGGYLSGKYRRGEPIPKGARFADLEDKFMAVEPEKLFDIVEALEKIAREHSASVSQTALNYLLQKPGVNSLIIGIRTVEQLEENLKVTDLQITPEELALLDRLSQPKQEYPYFVYDPELDAYVRV